MTRPCRALVRDIQPLNREGRRRVNGHSNVVVPDFVTEVNLLDSRWGVLGRVGTQIGYASLRVDTLRDDLRELVLYLLFQDNSIESEGPHRRCAGTRQLNVEQRPDCAILVNLDRAAEACQATSSGALRY